VLTRRIAFCWSLRKCSAVASYQHTELVLLMQSKLFNCVLSSPQHVCQLLAPLKDTTGYILISIACLQLTTYNVIRMNFLYRMLFTRHVYMHCIVCRPMSMHCIVLCQPLLWAAFFQFSIKKLLTLHTCLYDLYVTCVTVSTQFSVLFLVSEMLCQQ